MKNFFKKLSFVLAVAMVLTSIAPATAHAAADYIYKKGKDSAVETVNVWFGDKATDLNVKVNGKKNVAGTWKVGNKNIATIDQDGVITPVKNGKTTVAFVAKTGEKVKATLVVGTRAAGIKVKDNGVAIDELTMTVGETKELKFGAYISGKAKNAGAKKASQAVTFSFDGSAISTEQNGKYVTVAAEQAGEATITFTAGKKTTAVKVTVEPAKVEVSAKQTGANKITVTGSDLTDVAADYVVKRGNVTLSLKSVELVDGTAVITAASSNMPAGDYTLSFKGGEAVTFTVEEAVVANIVIEPEFAIMTSSKEAIAYYKVFNQFDEDVTTGTLGSYVTVSGSDNVTLDRANKKVTFKTTSATGYTMNVSQVSLALVCTKNGVNVSKILTVVEEAKLKTVEFAGVRVQNNDGNWVETTLTEGLTDDKLFGTYYLFFKGVDQYDMTYPADKVDSKNLQLNVSSITGLAVSAAAVTTKYNAADYTTYVAYPLTTANENGIANGTVTLLGVVLTSGETVSATVDVASAKKVDTLTIADMNGVYGGQKNALYFEAISEDGEVVTDYATLVALNDKFSPKYDDTKKTGVRFERNADGSASLYYYAETNDSTIAVPAVITCLTLTNKFTSANLNVQPDCVATAIIGIDADKALAGTSGATLTLGKTNFIFEDQYGNVLSDDSAAVGAAKIQVTDIYGTAGNNFTNVSTGSSVSLKCASHGGVNLKVVLLDEENKEVAGSDYTFAMWTVDINKVSNFAIADFDLLHVGEDIEANLDGVNSSAAAMVTGTYAGMKVALQPSDYTVVTVTTAPAIDASKDGYTIKEANVTVVIKNTVGTELNKTYKYSNIPSYAAHAMVMPYVTSFYYTNIAATVAKNVAVDTTTLARVATSWDAANDPNVWPSILYVVDQYGDFYTEATEMPRVTISEFDATDATVLNNSTGEASISFATAGYKTVHVKYVWSSGTTFETDVTICVY